MGRTKFIDIGFRFHVSASAIASGSTNGLVWLTEIGPQKWPEFNKAEMPEYSRPNVEEGLPGLRETGIGNWIYHM